MPACRIARRLSRVDVPDAHFVHEPAFRAFRVPYCQARDLGREAVECAREVAVIPHAHDDEHPRRLELEGGGARCWVVMLVRRLGLVCIRSYPQRGSERRSNAWGCGCRGDEPTTEMSRRRVWAGTCVA